MVKEFIRMMKKNHQQMNKNNLVNIGRIRSKIQQVKLRLLDDDNDSDNSNCGKK